MRRTLTALVAAGLLAGPATGDEFRDVLDSALAAYSEGDVAGAQQDLEYAQKLLTEIKADSLSRFLPEAPPGWVKEPAEAEGAGLAMAMFGGGTAAAARYRRGSAAFTLTLIANSPMASGIGAMVSGLASVAGTGTETLRIQRTEFAVSGTDMQGLVGGKVLVSASGDAATADKAAVIEAMDLRALAAF